MHWAAYCGHDKSIKALQKAGANPNLEDNRGWTPSKLARFLGRADLVRQLHPEEILNESRVQKAKKLRGSCDACLQVRRRVYYVLSITNALQDLRGSQHHCETCREYDLCFRCFLDAPSIHPNHGFSGEFPVSVACPLI